MIDYKTMAESFTAFRNRCEEIAIFMRWPHDDINVDGDEAWTGGMVRGSWGSSDYESYVFPVAWMGLSNEEFKQRYDEKAEQDRIKANKRKEEETAKEAADKVAADERRDRSNYERLKVKYKGNA